MSHSLPARSRMPLHGALRAASMAYCKGGPAAWDPLPRGFDHGSGPTIRHAQGPISDYVHDEALVAAASRGHIERVVALLPRASSPNVRARSAAGRACSHGPGATTPLHAAAAHGSPDVVRILLTSRANPNSRHSGLRCLTALHEASTVAVAEVLLAAGASANATDPREPDPAWYHRQRGRRDVANCVTAFARAALQVTGSDGVISAGVSSRLTPTGRSLSSPRKIWPSLSAGQVALARRAWSRSGAALLSDPDFCAVEPISSFLSSSPSSQTSGGDFGSLECAICLSQFRHDDECLLLPCSNSTSSLSSTWPTAQVAAGERVCCSHVFHTACLERWWSKSCQCPTCRRDVRQWLSSLPPAVPASPQVSPLAPSMPAPMLSTPMVSPFRSKVSAARQRRALSTDMLVVGAALSDACKVVGATVSDASRPVRQK